MSRRSPLLALVGVTAIWGVTFVQVQDALALYPLFAFLAVRFAISTLALAPFAWKSLRTLPRRGYAAGIGVGVFLAVAYGLQTAGLELTTVASTGFITGLYVVFTPLLALVVFGTAGTTGALGRCGARGRRAPAPERRPGRFGAGKRARARERRVPGVPDHRHGAIRAALRPARADVPADGDVVRRLRGHRGRPRRARGAARGDRVGGASRDRALRRRARLPHRHLGAGAHDCSASRARLHARGAVRGAVRRAARRRGAGVGGMARLHGDDGRDPPRGARGRPRAPAHRRPGRY